MSETVIATVRVTQTADELSDGDDKVDLPAGSGGRGSYRDYEVGVRFTRRHPPGWVDPEDGETEDEAAVLDQFHATVAIGCLEDFQIDVLDVKSFSRPDLEGTKLKDKVRLAWYMRSGREIGMVVPSDGAAILIDTYLKWLDAADRSEYGLAWVDGDGVRVGVVRFSEVEAVTRHPIA